MAEPSSAPSPAAGPAAGALRAARFGLAVLTLINLLNYLDRFVVSALVESLKRSEMRLSDTQLGWLATGFILVYMGTAPLFGGLGDRGRRPRIVAAGVAIWSLATGLGGFARSFIWLFVARAAVGIGEAAYGTISPSLLADYFPRSQRGRVFALFNAAIPIGSAAGFILGGLVDRRFGWRAAFFVAGFPGLALAWLASRLTDPPRGLHDREAAGAPGGEVGAAMDGGGGRLAVYLDLLRNRPYVLTVLGYAIYTFGLGALAFWSPAFLERERGMSHVEATVTFGAIVVATGFVGTFIGGWLGDYLLRRWRQAYLWVSGVATLAAAPFAMVAFVASSRAVYMPAMVLAEVLLFVSTGPVNSAVVDVVRPDRRATAVALSIFAIHLLGDVPSPPLIGWVSDQSSLARAFLILPFAFAAGGLVWLYAAWRGERAAVRAS
jgi:MFS family permease